MDCGLQTGEADDLVHTAAPGALENPSTGTWVPDDNDGSSLLAGSRICTDLTPAQLPDYHSQCAQLRYHADQLGLPAEVQQEGVEVLRRTWIDRKQATNRPVASKVAAVLYLAARQARCPLTLRAAVAQVSDADSKATVRHFLQLQAGLPAPLPRFAVCSPDCLLP